MAFCGHQFRAGDENDWILSTSANFIGGNTMAREIMEELFKRHYDTVVYKPKKVKKSEEDLLEKLPSPPEPSTPPRPPEKVTHETSANKNVHLTIKKIPQILSFENFDESQHLNGCPVKWLYNKKLMEKNKRYKVERWCSKKAQKQEESKKEKNSNLKDKTPTEVKIHKINLIEKYSSNYDDNSLVSSKYDPNAEFLEERRKNLAAKLNWKLHDESQEETCSELSSRHNYLPPRPLLGLNPLLSILLSPQTDTTCCSVGELSKIKSATDKKVEASLTIQSLDLPFFLPEPKPRPKALHSSRWGAKTTRLQKKLQIPNQVTLNIRQTQAVSPESENEVRVFSGKKKKEKSKQTKSLSTLFYEFKDKTNNRKEAAEYLEEMIRDIAMEESLFKIKKFFNLNLEDKRKAVREKKSELEYVIPKISKNQLNLICNRAKFFEKCELKKIKQYENFNKKNIETK